MKIDDLRKRFRPGQQALVERALAAPAAAPVLSMAPFSKEVLSNALTVAQVDQPMLTTVEFALRDALNGSVSKLNMMTNVGLRASGWPTGTSITIASADSTLVDKRMFAASIASPVDGDPGHRQMCLMKLFEREDGPAIRIYIPEPCLGSLYKPRHKMASGITMALMREAIRSYGWPACTRGVITTTYHSHALARGELYVALFDDPKSDVPAVEAMYNIAMEMPKIPMHPSTTLMVDHKLMVEMSK